MLCSGDMPLHPLVAGAGATLQATAALMQIRVAGKVVAEGEVDVRGTLAMTFGRARRIPIDAADLRTGQHRRRRSAGDAHPADGTTLRRYPTLASTDLANEVSEAGVVVDEQDPCLAIRVRPLTSRAV
jgi:hypothetical protein